MASQGPLSGGTFSSVDRSSTTNWNTPTGATASDDGYANVTLTSLDEESDYLQATNFGFSIPGGATIDGIVVEVERHETISQINDAEFRILKGGSITGDNKPSAVEWPLSDTYQSYGGSSDLWGLSWTVADINASDFGTALAVTNSGGSTTTANVDHIRITVHYTPGASAAGGRMALLGVGT